ncbi:MAG: Ig-like domain-containing protein [Myxococcota bacterium]
MRTTLASLVLFLVTACGASNDGNPTDGGESDLIAPSIVATSPATDDRGVEPTAVVTITFSEPMDPKVTEDNLDLTDFPAASLSWSDDQTTLTITPDEPFEVVVTDPVSDAPPANHRVIVGADAADLAGNPLGQVTEVDFTVIREFSVVFFAIDAMTRTITPQLVEFEIDQPLVVGDNASDEGYRTAITYGLALPDDADPILAATFHGTQLPDDRQGDAYAELGSLTLDHVTFGELLGENNINAAFNSSQVAHSSLSDVITDELVEDFEVDVTDQVQDDVTNGRSESQYLLYFDGFTDLMGDSDRAVFERGGFELEVRYNAP